ncbi:MAG: hypothetical protein LBC52_07965 [Treponema sp.]|jgi:hypothetical protein|nr:hypothetical protein [Treponema sp.]
MKKIGMTAFAILLLCVLTGCPTDDGGKTPASMTFVDNINNPAKEFIIDENLGFKVTFIKPDSMEQAMSIQPSEVISGKITEADAAWNTNLTGTATQMISTNEMINSVVTSLPPIAISLAYKKSGDAITEVTVAFPKDDSLSQQAQLLMGKTYFKK